ncbi:hypothetical protein BZA70DRAFT_87698 [Myxozyma melibiosi]|uniref:Uncharacterized protein n=1 Tax=Myxozyma melibiosi TaxID=54550 RepID=A0ABR1F1D8_9ASCO
MPLHSLAIAVIALLALASVLATTLFLAARARRRTRLASSSRAHNRSSSVLLSVSPEVAAEKLSSESTSASSLASPDSTPRAARTSVTLARSFSNASTLVGSVDSTTPKKLAVSPPSVLTTLARTFSLSPKPKPAVPEIRITFPEEYDSESDDDSNYSSDSNSSFETDSLPESDHHQQPSVSRRAKRPPRCVVVEISESGPAFVRELVESDDSSDLLPQISCKKQRNDKTFSRHHHDAAAESMLHDIDLNAPIAVRS